jgi:signal transduction histidine kinase
MLGRLGIRQKLALILAIPLAAVLLVLVPFTVERVNDARSAAATARTALVAREIGGLIQTLQQERLIALGYLSAPSLDRSALVAQTQTSIDTIARLRADPATAGIMLDAAFQIEALNPIRQGVLSRSTLNLTVYNGFRTANTALLDALRLANPPGVDALGLNQLGSLDSLMRSNEEASSVGALLVAAAADPTLSRSLLAEAITADQQYLLRYRQLVPLAQSALVDAVEKGQAGQRIRQITLAVNQAGAASPTDVSEALTAAISYTGLRRLAQDRAAREIATTAQSRADTARNTAYGVVGGAVALIVIVVVLGVTVGRSIARPLRRLTRAAAVVAELSRAELVRVSDSDSADPAPPRLAAVEVDSSDEIGELAAALNQVQATAALLLERQVTTRGNVAVMFANIARRTQNLVGRQLSLIDDLERTESRPDLLQRLYRLDHVATRLRRSADSLLVVSGTIDQAISGAPTPLPDVVRSALSEIEGFQAVDIGELPQVALSAGLVTDLRLLLAELLENATNFSPPGSRVEISATIGEDCRVVIVDHGVGLGPARLEEENQRLVERERLDVAPTTVLGLFVVGRLARRHGLSARLDHSDGRGVTATVRIPLSLLSTGKIVGPPPTSTRMRPLPAIRLDLFENSGEPFGWFDPRRSPGTTGRASTQPVPAPAAPALPVRIPGPPGQRPAAEAASWRGEVARGQVPRGEVPRGEVPRGQVPQRDLPRGEAPPGQLTSAGLARRVPGTHMVEVARTQPQAPAARPARAKRDPEAEREALNDYLSGLSRDSDNDGPARPTGPTLAERHP